jgi:hypothetical protein
MLHIHKNCVMFDFPRKKEKELTACMDGANDDQEAFKRFLCIKMSKLVILDSRFSVFATSTVAF